MRGAEGEEKEREASTHTTAQQASEREREREASVSHPRTGAQRVNRSKHSAVHRCAVRAVVAAVVPNSAATAVHARWLCAARLSHLQRCCWATMRGRLQQWRCHPSMRCWTTSAALCVVQARWLCRSRRARDGEGAVDHCGWRGRECRRGARVDWKREPVLAATVCRLARAAPLNPASPCTAIRLWSSCALHEAGSLLVHRAARTPRAATKRKRSPSSIAPLFPCSPRLQRSAQQQRRELSSTV